MKTYAIPASSVEVENDVKKSRFIARAAYADSREAALLLIEQARKDYPDARHHCWAYLLGNPQAAASAAMSDDGEPSGTAGKPILNVLQHKQVGDVLIIVIRYFGGIKLGAGGLVRAYSAAAQMAMDALEVVQHEARCSATVGVDFAKEQELRHWLSKNDGAVVSTEYGERVVVVLSLLEKTVNEFELYAAAAGIALLSREW